MKRKARESMRGKHPPVLGVGAVYLLIALVISYFTTELLGIDDLYATTYDALIKGVMPDVWSLAQTIPPMANLISAALEIIGAVIAAGFASYCLKLSRGQETSVKDLFDGFTIFFKVIWLNIVMGVLVLLWSLLLIVPGIIAGYRYSQALYILLDNPDMPVLACIGASKQIMRGHKAELFVLNLSFIGWSIVSEIIAITIMILIGMTGVKLAVAIPILNIWLMPYVSTTYAVYYGQLSKNHTGGDYQGGEL
jgi:uncharacterized membrane protein